VKVTGGDMLQSKSQIVQIVQIGGLTQIQFTVARTRTAGPCRPKRIKRVSTATART
jgi:hypothetical protein